MAYCYSGVVQSYVRYTESGNQYFNIINVSGGKDSFCFYGMHDKHDNTYYLQSYYLPTAGLGNHSYHFNINIKEIVNGVESVGTKRKSCSYPGNPYPLLWHQAQPSRYPAYPRSFCHPAIHSNPRQIQVLHTSAAVYTGWQDVLW